MARQARPLSPHLHIYKPQLTSVLSIVHRATGVFLALGTPLVCWELLALAGGPQSYTALRALCGSWFGALLLLGWSWSLCYHLLNGIRHLVWDAGVGFEIRRAYQTGWTVVVLSVVLTASIWGCVLARTGAA